MSQPTSQQIRPLEYTDEASKILDSISELFKGKKYKIRPHELLSLTKDFKKAIKPCRKLPPNLREQIKPYVIKYTTKLAYATYGFGVEKSTTDGVNEICSKITKRWGFNIDILGRIAEDDESEEENKTIAPEPQRRNAVTRRSSETKQESKKTTPFLEFVRDYHAEKTDEDEKFLVWAQKSGYLKQLPSQVSTQDSKEIKESKNLVKPSDIKKLAPSAIEKERDILFSQKELHNFQNRIDTEIKKAKNNKKHPLPYIYWLCANTLTTLINNYQKICQSLMRNNKLELFINKNTDLKNKVIYCACHLIVMVANYLLSDSQENQQYALNCKAVCDNILTLSNLFGTKSGYGIYQDTVSTYLAHKIPGILVESNLFHHEEDDDDEIEDDDSNVPDSGITQTSTTLVM